MARRLEERDAAAIHGTAWAKKDEQTPTCACWRKPRSATIGNLGVQLDLFHVQEESLYMVFWHPKGWALWQNVEQYMRCK